MQRFKKLLIGLFHMTEANSTAEGTGRRVKCEGRFHEIRDYIYDQAFPLILDGATTVNEAHLQDVWGLVGMDIHSDLDRRDPYFFSKVDKLRRQPWEDAISLVPLVEAQLHLEEGVLASYARSMGCNPNLAANLDLFRTQSRRLLQEHLRLEPKDIIFPSGERFTGYRVAVNYGIGTISRGGDSGGGIRSDSPFLLELYQDHTMGPKRGETDLAAVVGFWPQNNEMLVAQIQSCRNAKLPEKTQFGVACLHVAEVIARRLGFERISTYSARDHPIFMEHPNSWNQLASEFTCMYDGSAKKLGYGGSRQGGHEKSLVHLGSR